MAQLVKNPPGMRETWVQCLGWEDSPGGGHGYLIQYSYLENSMDKGVWRALECSGFSSCATGQLSCFSSCGILPDKGSDLYLLH